MTETELDYYPADACEKYAQVCKLRYERLMDIREGLLFRSLEKMCLQAARYAKEHEEGNKP